MIMIRKSFSILIAVTSIAGAQNSNRSAVCWRPHALANCQSWIVTESAIEGRIASSSPYRYDSMGRPYTNATPIRVPLTGGVMVNVGDRRAIGLIAAAMAGDIPARFETRFREWRRDRGAAALALVLLLGPLLATENT